jgi:hypothetical protein
VRTKLRKKLTRHSRVPTPRAMRLNQKWSMDFMSPRLLDGRWFRVLTVIDQFTREYLALTVDSHLVALFRRWLRSAEPPNRSAADNSSEFARNEGWDSDSHGPGHFRRDFLCSKVFPCNTFSILSRCLHSLQLRCATGQYRRELNSDAHFCCQNLFPNVPKMPRLDMAG